MRQFIGLASYYQRLIPRFANIAAPLHKLTNLFEWTPECESSFAQLKQLLVEAPVLVYPLFGSGEEFLFETDTSDVELF